MDHNLSKTAALSPFSAHHLSQQVKGSAPHGSKDHFFCYFWVFLERISLAAPDCLSEPATQAPVEQVTATKKGTHRFFGTLLLLSVPQPRGVQISFVPFAMATRSPPAAPASRRHYSQRTRGFARAGEAQGFLQTTSPNVDSPYLDSTSFFLAIACLFFFLESFKISHLSWNR